VCVGPTEFISTIEKLLAAQSESQAALLGAVKSGMQARDKEASPAFNWLLTHTGRDVTAVIKATVEAALPGKGLGTCMHDAGAWLC
jgi:myo-inositol-1-phosphate synthase